MDWVKIRYGKFPPPIGEPPSGRVSPEASLETIGWEIYLAINPKIW